MAAGRDRKIEFVPLDSRLQLPDTQTWTTSARLLGQEKELPAGSGASLNRSLSRGLSAKIRSMFFGRVCSRRRAA